MRNSHTSHSYRASFVNTFYSTGALAEKLGVGIHTIYYWRDKGIIQASQEIPGGPWWYRITPEVLESLRSKIRPRPVKFE